MKNGKLSFKMFILLTALAVTGCAPKVVQLSSNFDKTTAKNLLVDGTNAILGNALIRQQGGGVVTCAGYEVNLTPVTEYATERMLYLYQSDQSGYNSRNFNQKFQNDDPDYLRLAKTTQCDAQGNFEFENITDGEFYVTTTVFWMPGQYIRNGGHLMKRVKVAGGETKKIILSP